MDELIFLRSEVYEIIQSWQFGCVTMTTTQHYPSLSLNLHHPVAPGLSDPCLDFKEKCQLSYISSWIGCGLWSPRVVILLLVTTLPFICARHKDGLVPAQFSAN